MEDLQTLLTNHSIEFRTEHRDVRNGWLGVQCPECGKPEEYYLGFHLHSNAANCWRCGPKNPYDVLTSLGIPSKQVVPFLRSGVHSKPPAVQSRGLYRPPKHIALDGPSAAPFKRYLWARGFDPDEIAQIWGVGGIRQVPMHYAWRLLIPVSLNGTCVSWTTRSINPHCAKGARYIGAKPENELYPLRSVLYGAEYCNHACIVVEGPTDAWRIGPGAVATMGIGVTPEQELAIARYPVRVIAFDNEYKAQKRADSLCRRLSKYQGRTIIFVLDSADPSTASQHEIDKLKSYL